MISKRLLTLPLVILLTLGLVSMGFAANLSPNIQAIEVDEPSEETKREQELARAAELNPAPVEMVTTLAGVNAVQYPLFVGVDDAAIPAYQIDPTTNGTIEAFTGAQVWGAAYDVDNDIVYFNNGTQLYEWPVGGAINLLGTITDPGGGTQSMVGLAFYNGTLYGIKNIANEAVWSIDTTSLVATVYIDYADDEFDLGGLAVDPVTGNIYATNDDTTPNGSGLFRINLDGTGTLIAAYPDAQTDIDGLAISRDGSAYLIIDEPGSIYVYDFAAAAYTTPLVNPWTTSEVFSAGAWIYELNRTCPAGTAEYTILTESFEGSFPPPGWVVANNTTGCVAPGVPDWTNTDPEARGNLTGGSGLFAIADSDACGSGSVMNAQMWTPAVDLTGYTEPQVTYYTDYNDISASSDVADLDFSIDGGATWTNLISWNEDHRGPLQIDQVFAADGQANTVLRWNYTNATWDWWWQIDEVKVTACGPAPAIDVNPSSLSSLQNQDTVTQQTLTVSNLGEPGSVLHWQMEEGPKLTVLDATTPVVERQSAPPAEVVGAQVPEQTAGSPSEIGLVSKPFAPTAVLYDNGPIVTHPGSGSGGADASALQSALGMTIYGFGHAVSSGFRVADDFTVTDAGGWRIDSITFFAYQTGSGTTSTIDHVNLRIWDGPPSDPASSVVFGDTTTNRLVNTTWTSIYRVLDTALTNTDRPVMADTVSVGVSLPPGTYWLDWQTGGTLASGPWAPPISILGQTTTGNGLQYDPTSALWNPLNDTGTVTQQGLPFVIEGGVLGCGVDIPWVSVSPITGSLPAGGAAELEVTFDSTGLAKGEYTGDLCLNSNDPLNPQVLVPITMTVADVAYLEVAHLAPFAADPGTAVTVTVDGAPVLTGFEYGESTDYLSVLAGERLIEVYPLGSVTPAITGTVNLITDTYNSAIAVGGANGWSLDLLALEDDHAATPAGKFKLRLGHLAPFAAGAGTLADVRLQDGTVILDDVPFGAVAGYLELDAGTYDLKITSPDGALTLIDPLPVTFNEGDLLYAFATGDGVNQPLGVFAWFNGAPGFFLPLASYGVELSPPTAAQSGAPGETVVYSLIVTNTSDVTDTFTVGFSGNAWVTTVADGSFELAAGESILLEVNVTIPASADDGDVDVATVTVGGAGGESVSSVLTTTAVISTRKVFLPGIPQGYSPP